MNGPFSIAMLNNQRVVHFNGGFEGVFDGGKRGFDMFWPAIHAYGSVAENSWDPRFL